MGAAGFIYKGQGIDIQRVRWIEKQGNCNLEENPCFIRVDDSNRCASNLSCHACKHVIWGSDEEKNKYKHVVRSLGKNENIPMAICSVKDEIVKNYEEMSRAVLEDTETICIAGDSGNIRVVCEGKDRTEGISDFLGFYTEESHYGKYTRFGIVSSYFNNVSSDKYALYVLCYQRYYEKNIRVRELVQPLLWMQDILGL